MPIECEIRIAVCEPRKKCGSNDGGSGTSSAHAQYYLLFAVTDWMDVYPRSLVAELSAVYTWSKRLPRASNVRRYYLFMSRYCGKFMGRVKFDDQPCGNWNRPINTFP